MISPPIRETRFRLTEDQARALAAEVGTPLYVVDETHFRSRIRDYWSAVKASHPKGEISFAAKANSTVALLLIAHQEGCSIDVASEGELRAALAAGVPASACHCHGNNKTAQELRFAIEQGVAHIVVDNFPEIEQIAELKATTKIVLRLAPGVDPLTHQKISTGQADTKFGFNIADGSAERATTRCLEVGLNLIGFHCHVGSQLLDPEAQITGGQFLAEFAVEMLERHGFRTQYLNVGGGLGVVYTSADEPMNVREYCKAISHAVSEVLAPHRLDPILGQEPGRSLIAESGITLYRVGVVKTVPSKTAGHRTYVVVDGGLSDNPRPVMYGSRYTVERISPPLHGPTRPMTVSGKHCETDKLFEDVPLPDDIKRGDLIQVLCTGGYNSTMASNYNRYPRPATALIRADGRISLIQRRENWEEMFAREMVPPDLTAGI